MFLIASIAHKMSRQSISRWFVFVCILWVLIFGLRGYGVGNDTPGYSNFFQNKNIGYDDYGNVTKGSDMEPGFIFIARIIKFIADSPTIFFTVLAIWLFYFIYKIYFIVCGSQRSLGSLLVIFIIANSFVTLMVATRQSAAICVLLTGIYILLKNKGTYRGSWKDVIRSWKLLAGLIIIASTVLIHKSFILLVPIMLLAYFLKFKKRTMYIMIGTSLVLSLFFMRELGQLFNSFFVFFGNAEISFVNTNIMEIYGQNFGGNNQKIITFIAWVTPLILTIYLSDKRQYKTFFFNCYVFSVCFFMLFSTSYLIERINTPLVLLGFTQFMPAIVNKSPKWRTVYLFFIFLMLANAFIRYSNWPSTDSCIPYYFFWEHNIK